MKHATEAVNRLKACLHEIEAYIIYILDEDGDPSGLETRQYFPIHAH
jgi:hypothetical protein